MQGYTLTNRILKMRLCSNYGNRQKQKLMGYFMTLSSSSSQSPNRPGELHLSLFLNISAKRAHHRSSVSFVTDVIDLCVHGEEVRKEAGGLWGKRMNFSD